MRVEAFVVSISILIFLTAFGAAYGLDGAEVRSAIATSDYTWNSQNFPGFYYDADGDLGTEQLTATITDGSWLSGDSPYGLVYMTSAQTKRFGHSPWGSYRVIGFLGKPHFAGYINDANIPESDQLLLKESGGANLLSIQQLREVLIDNDTEITMVSSMPLRFKEGYQLEIRSVDEKSDHLYLELMKDGQVVDSKSISPSKSDATESDRTYYYSKESDSGNKMVIIAAHFKNAFRGADQDLATVSGLWQLSETPLDVSADSVFDKMRVSAVDSTNGQIWLDNKDYRITLQKGKDITLMPGFGLKTADSNAVRYYIYKSIDNPGIYEVRGSAATGDFTWNAQNFQGFYYDPDKDIGTEVLSVGLTEGISLSGDSPYGLTYRTMAQAKSFKFSDWGQYNIIGFLGKGYFAGYAQESDSDPSQQILRINSKSPNLLNTDGLSEILFDDNREQTVPKGSSLKLKQGYELLIKSVNQDGQAYLELLKDGKAIDSKILAPSAEGATMADKTYWYAKAFGSSNIVTLAVHLKNVYRDEDVAAATVDGIWQISDQFMPIKVGSQYGLMNVASYSADSLTMDNKDHAIRLSRNKDISIMPGLNIRVADNDTLKYYPYTTVTVNESTVKSAPEGTGLQNEAPGIMPEAEKTSYSEGSQDNLTAANEDKGITTGKQRENTSKAIDPGI